MKKHSKIFTQYPLLKIDSENGSDYLVVQDEQFLVVRNLTENKRIEVMWNTSQTFEGGERVGNMQHVFS